jgi:hypothetical protein
MQERPPEQGSAKINSKRPQSHYWVIGIFGFITLGAAIFISELLIGGSSISLGSSWDRVLVFLMGGLAVFSLLLGGRRRWVYYISSVALVVWLLRLFYTWLWYFERFLSGGGTISAPDIHMFEQGQPLVTHHDLHIGRQFLFESIGIALFVWLLVRFISGKPSRRFFGFEDFEKDLQENQNGSGGATYGNVG